MSTRVRLLSATLALGSAVLGCDEAKQVEADGTASVQANATTIAAKDFELAAVVELVEREDVRDAESLEALLNAEDSTIRVDVDDDGTRDFIAVHEVGKARAEVDAKVELAAEADGAVAVAGDDGEKVQFELRAIPSSKLEVETEAEVVELAAEAETTSVVVATVDIELHTEAKEVVVEAHYAPTVTVVSDVELAHHYTHRVALEHRHDHLVVVGAPLLAWVWIDVRPVYVGHLHLPPGHAKKLGLHWNYDGHHGHHDKTRVVIHESGHGHGHGGADKVGLKTKGGGKAKTKAKTGSGKVEVKVEVKAKAKAKTGKGGKGKH